VNQGVALLGRCLGRDDWALYTAFEGRGFVTVRGAVTEAAKRRREEHDPHRDDESRFRDLDVLYDGLDGDTKRKLDEDVDFFCSLRTDGFSQEQVRFLRYRLLYMMFSDCFPSRPLNVAAQGLMNTVKDIDWNWPGLIKSFQIDPTRGYGSVGAFDKASRRLALESWVRSNNKNMTTASRNMEFLGGHPSGGMERSDGVPALTRQIEMVHNRCASVYLGSDARVLGFFFFLSGGAWFARRAAPSATRGTRLGPPAAREMLRFARRVERPQMANLASLNFHRSIVVGGVSMDTPENQTPPPASRYADTCPVHDLAGPTEEEVHDENGGLAPPKKIKEITRKLAPHTFGAVLTAPHDIDVVCLNSALNAQIGYEFYEERGYDVTELGNDAYARFGSNRRRAVSVSESLSTRWGAWLVTKERELPFFVTTTCHAGSTWCGPYAHQGYGWGKDRVGDIKMQQANLERGLAGKKPMPLETSAFALFDFDPRRAQALVDERFAVGSPPWTHPTVRGGQMSAQSKQKVQEKANAAREVFERVRARYRPGSQEYVDAKSKAERLEDEADRVYNRGVYHWFVPLREAAERVRVAGNAASDEDRALARQWEEIREGTLKNLKLGWNLQARANEAEEIAALPGATDQEKKEAKRLRASAERQLANLKKSDRVLSLWAAARAPGATQEDVAEFERMRDAFRAAYATRGKFGYRNVAKVERRTKKGTKIGFYAAVNLMPDQVRGPHHYVSVDADDTDAAIAAAARDADVIYIALFRKWYAFGDMDFDVDHPLALELNFPEELDVLEKRSRNVEDSAMKGRAMQEFLAPSDTASALPSSASVRDPAVAGPSGSGPIEFSRDVESPIELSGDEESSIEHEESPIELSGDEEDNDDSDTASSSTL
jgi:hypothetical protein